MLGNRLQVRCSDVDYNSVTQEQNTRLKIQVRHSGARDRSYTLEQDTG
jgi:hypothetical protein